MKCTRCGTPVVMETEIDEHEPLCRLCTRETRRNRVTMTNLHELDDTGAPTPLAPVIDPALHRRVDRDLTLLDGLDLIALGRTLHQAINVDRANPSTPDGFRNSTPGANPNAGRGVRLADPEGEVTWTPVESAANRRPQRDEYHAKVELVVGYVTDAAHALRAAVTKLAELEQLRANAGLQAGDPGCWAMERIGKWEDVHATIVIDGEQRKLGNWAYRFWRDHHRLPSMAECTARTEGRRVMVKADAR